MDALEVVQGGQAYRPPITTGRYTRRDPGRTRLGQPARGGVASGRAWALRLSIGCILIARHRQGRRSGAGIQGLSLVRVPRWGDLNPGAGGGSTLWPGGEIQRVKPRPIQDVSDKPMVVGLTGGCMGTTGTVLTRVGHHRWRVVIIVRGNP